MTEEIHSNLEDILSKSFRLQSGLGKFLLLRACFGACRESRLLRSLGFKDGLFLASQSSVPFRRAPYNLPQGLATDEQFTLACMASRRGGLGLKNPTWTHSSAFLSSCFTYAASADAVSLSLWEDLFSARQAVRSALDLPVDFLAEFASLSGFDPRDTKQKKTLATTTVVAGAG